MNKMVAANGRRITIAHHHKGFQARFANLSAGGKGQSSAMRRVDSVQIHISAHSGRTANARNQQHIILRITQLVQSPSQSRHHNAIAAAGTPDVRQIIPKVFLIYSFHQQAPPITSASLDSTACLMVAGVIRRPFT